MSRTAARARLDLTRLDDRAVPSTVTSTTTARPLDFTGTGTLTTTDPTLGNPERSTNVVTVTGTLDYTSAGAGTSGLVQVTGSGSGTGLIVPATDATGTTATGTTLTPTGDTTVVDFAQIVQGKFAFDDAGGAVTVTDPLVGSAAWFTVNKGAGTLPLGPLDGAGTFDVSTYKFQTDLTSTAGTGQTGTITVTLADKTATATDLAFDPAGSAAFRAADGTIGADFAVDVTGRLMTAATHSTAATRVTAVWGDGAGRTQAADVDVPIYWNTGRVVVDASGLTPPAWATTLTVKLDAAGTVAEATETNNTWLIRLAELTAEPTSPPPATPPGDDDSPPPVTGPVTPPVVRPGQPAGFSIADVPDGSFVQWRDSTGRVIRSVPAFIGYGGGVSVAAGDVTGDGILDVAIGAGAGGAPHVRVLNGATGEQLISEFVYAEDFRGGVNVALGDLDGDGRAELIVGAGVGGSPHVRVLDATTGEQEHAFAAFEIESRGGVTVAAVDLNSDGRAEIVTGAGVGGGPVIAVFDGVTYEEQQRVLAGSIDDRGGADVRVTKHTDGYFLVTSESEQAGSLTRFRQQLPTGGPLLVAVIDPQLYPAQLYGGVDPLTTTVV